MIRWTYGLCKADGTMETKFSDGPLSIGELEKLLGGRTRFVEFRDGTTAAVRMDPRGLPENSHFSDQEPDPVKRLYGDVVLGKKLDGMFLGMLGVEVPPGKDLPFTLKSIIKPWKTHGES